ncbi:MAG: FAD-dependent oxidoreductase [Acidimicrobiales bacterium]
MARVVVAGAGVVGLSTAMLLARDGHDVAVVERDAAVPPEPDKAWADWERRGINQFRLLHFFLPRFHNLLEAELPDVAKALDDAGAVRYNPIRQMPDEMTGGARPEDASHEALTGRRPVVEAAIAAVGGATPGVTIRRGVPVAGLLAGGEGHAVGLRTEAGEEIRADLVVDAMGRRSPLPSWLEAIGGARPDEELDDSGFVYYGRHFRGTQPVLFGPLLQDYGSISILTLPADNGTWGLGVITSSKDTAMRSLSDTQRWTSVVQNLPLAAHWLDGEPIEDKPTVMAKIEDRHRSFVVGGRPVATGVLAVGDSWACTNPSVGRGASIGLMHAVALRDLLRDEIADPAGLALAWHDVTMRTVEPYYRSTLAYDHQRLADVAAILDGREPHVDEQHVFVRALGAAAGQDADCLRALLKLASMLALPEDLQADAALCAKVDELGRGWRDAPAIGPTRDELVALTA